MSEDDAMLNALLPAANTAPTQELKRAEPPASVVTSNETTTQNRELSGSVERQQMAASIEATAEELIASFSLPTQADVEAFQQDFKRAMTKANLDWSGKIDLTVNNEGKVTVKGDHPHKERIEALFEQNPELRQGFDKTETVQRFRQIQYVYAQHQQMVDDGASQAAADQWLTEQLRRIKAQPPSVTLVDGRVSSAGSEQQGGLAAMERLQARYTASTL
ncbi:hypothetical protein CHH28_09860 [Bacterioplanes sanyensis]|uniref:Uncharacterized protein n=1 Tax=Bacterioplanes sanyensis TaxID=1249553 RepID=A0A222FIV2_9GAMM|nr:hypothetical protein [Bacterioplanes sanyensis]ASP38965.1 hypothetical protein CHH28_09860 [Bacterioplanes sanyensis]